MDTIISMNSSLLGPLIVITGEGPKSWVDRFHVLFLLEIASTVGF